MGSYLLGVDIGTYSSKGVLVDSSSGRVVAAHIVEHSLSMPKPGWVEHDADVIWWGEFQSICQQLLKSSQVLPKNIHGVGVSGIGNCVLPVDQDGKPLRPGILYGIDTRATEEIEQIEKQYGKEDIFQVSATHLSSSAAGPKILWLKNHEPDVYQEARWFLNSHSYVIYRLTGRATVDIYTACGYAPLFNVRERTWYAPFAKMIVPIEKLPEIVWSCEIVGSITSEAARITGLAEGTPVVGGAIDAAAEALSAGIQDFGDMMVMLGSSNSLILKTDKLVSTQNFWGLNWVEPGSYAVVGGMSTVGSLTRWFRDNLSHAELTAQAKGGENAYASIARLLDDSPPGANGLVALPYFEGERTPFYDPYAKGAFFGLTLKHSRADMYRAILESVGFGLRHNIQAMREASLSPKRILAVGGATKNTGWLQLISDIAGIEMQVPLEHIGASYGDALMAAVGAGILGSLKESTKWIMFRDNIIPNKENADMYSGLYQIFIDLYESTKNLMHRLSEIEA